MSTNYKDAGVDIEKGYEAVKRIKSHVESTHGPEVLSGIGGFGGLFAPDMTGMTQPVLVSGTDGVGTKLKIAFGLNQHDTIGIDCVAMCVNDVVCTGARPLFFLDYIATGELAPKQVEGIVAGIAEGCRQAGAALVGGETAEMPGFYAAGEYDVAGFSVGLVDRPNIIDGSTIAAGDVIIGLNSSGVHSNGFSLIRKLFPEKDWHKQLNARTLGDALLAPTRIYVQPVLKVLEKVTIKGIAHITGGGFIENIPRAFSSEFKAVIKTGTWTIQDIFPLIQSKSGLSDMEMFNTFNMGIGMTLILSEANSAAALAELDALGTDAQIIGRIEKRGEDEDPLCFE
ncbi:MAG: phosphoribosylformylglycinamidine cyclo-ligase [Candidatus Marinimicrobia bacterium]|nr:phosphoribosylformylglycinamidine cyclo-ligase [Candidatus Neomarinimicrobiota bacterium]MCF7850146.1 phosphoribosylformylglycinamidine cyclo-ligase [Candidatus Neomarinimicrobiota bacterium]